MKIGKTIIATIVITVLGAIVGAVTCGGVFNWVYKLEPTNVWKTMEAPGTAYYLGAILLNFIFVVAYSLLHEGIPVKKNLVKGLVFGLCVWGVGVLPGMFATYTFMTVAPTVIIYWTIMALILDPLKGIITAAIYGD